MMQVLIGSRAIKHWFPDFPREPKDTDIVTDTPPWGYQGSGLEYHNIPPLIDRIEEISVNGVLTANALYTLKVSHAFWDNKWEKTLFDIVWLRRKGCVLTHLVDVMYPYWCNKFGEPKRQDLDQSKEAFFNNALRNQDRHDDLHKILKNPPTYTKILVDEVKTSDKLFAGLSYEDKLSLIHEETCVMAYERLAGRDYRSAYIAQMKDMILRHLPFEQALFAVVEFDKLKMPFINYKKEIENELSGNHC
jgi:hypothetical protein